MDSSETKDQQADLRQTWAFDLNQEWKGTEVTWRFIWQEEHHERTAPMLKPERKNDRAKDGQPAFENCQKRKQPGDGKKPDTKQCQDIQNVELKIITGQPKIVGSLVYERHGKSKSGYERQ